MKSGDRVFIKDKVHPWYGHTGTLTDEHNNMGQYRVELDNGMAAGCKLIQLEKVTK